MIMIGFVIVYLIAFGAGKRQSDSEYRDFYIMNEINELKIKQDRIDNKWN